MPRVVEEEEKKWPVPISLSKKQITFLNRKKKKRKIKNKSNYIQELLEKEMANES